MINKKYEPVYKDFKSNTNLPISNTGEPIVDSIDYQKFLQEIWRDNIKHTNSKVLTS